MSGQTTRALEMACTDAMAGYRVAFLMHAESFLRYALDICEKGRLIPVDARVNHSRRRIDYPGGGSVEFFVASQPERMRGIKFDAVQVDNHAWASR